METRSRLRRNQPDKQPWVIINRNTLKPLRKRIDHRGYARVNLCKNGLCETHKVHRLVGIHFAPNVFGLSELNHKNEDKLDNRYENLEWCTRESNVNYGTRTERQKAKLSKVVEQLSLNNMLVAVFPSTVEAEKVTGVSRSYISM